MKNLLIKSFVLALILFSICCKNQKEIKIKNNLVMMYCDSIFYIENQECFSLRFRINYENKGDTIYLKNPQINFSSPVAENDTEGFKLVTKKINGETLLLSSPMIKKIKLNKNRGAFDLILKCSLDIDSIQNIKKYTIDYTDKDNPYLINEIVLEKAEIFKENLIIKE